MLLNSEKTNLFCLLGHSNRTSYFGCSTSVHDTIVFHQITYYTQRIMHATLGFLNYLQSKEWYFIINDYIPETPLPYIKVPVVGDISY